MSKIKRINEESLEFDNGFVLQSEHESNCCEYHWLDFSILEIYNDIYEQEFDVENGIKFKEVEGMGILLYDENGNKYLVNGYGRNNGWYSSNITLVLYNGKGKVVKEYDVTKCQDYYISCYNASELDIERDWHEIVPEEEAHFNGICDGLDELHMNYAITNRIKNMGLILVYASEAEFKTIKQLAECEW